MDPYKYLEELNAKLHNRLVLAENEQMEALIEVEKAASSHEIEVDKIHKEHKLEIEAFRVTIASLEERLALEVRNRAFDVSLPQDQATETNSHVVAPSAKSRECANFKITPFAMSEAEVKSRELETSSTVRIDTKYVVLKDTISKHRASSHYTCGFQLACHNCASYWYLLNATYISHGKIWDHAQSSITKARFLESLRMRTFIRVVICHMQFSVKNGRDRDENDQFVNKSLSRNQQMFQVLHGVTKSLGKKGVQYNNPADSHIVIDAVDGEFPPDYKNHFSPEFLEFSDQMHRLKLQAIEVVMRQFYFKTTGTCMKNCLYESHLFKFLTHILSYPPIQTIQSEYCVW